MSRPRPRPRPGVFEAKAKAKAAKFCPRAVLEVEASPRGPHPCEMASKYAVHKRNATFKTMLVSKHPSRATTPRIIFHIQQFLRAISHSLGQCSRKRVQHLKKRKKSCFLDFQKKTFKNRKTRHHIVMQPLITQLPEDGTGKSRSPTSNILLRSVDTKKLCN